MSERRPPAMFLAEAIGLDFLNTVAIPVDVEVEWLASGEDLLSWLKSAELIDRASIDEIRGKASTEELEGIAARARAMREWFRDFVVRYRGQPLPPQAAVELEPLNQLLARDTEYVQVVPRASNEAPGAGTALALVSQRRWQTPDALLFPVAKAIAALVTQADFTDIKKCESPTCVLHFLDTTRGRRRRWCSMAVCGNRAKQAAHRDRIAAR